MSRPLRVLAALTAAGLAALSVASARAGRPDLALSFGALATAISVSARAR